MVEETLLTPRFHTTDFEKAASLDLSAGQANLEVIRFFRRLDRCAARNLALKKLAQSPTPKVWKFLRKVPLVAGILGDLLRLYLIRPIDAEALRGIVR